MKKMALSLAVLGSSVFSTASAQWLNHYPKLDDFFHQVYLEQHELPLLSHGITDPAPAPNGTDIAFASKGWIWVLDQSTGAARRITNGASVDSRPRWSPDGTRIAFVRDEGDDTSIVVRTLRGGRETVIDTPSIELDPDFSKDGTYLYYSSGISGSLSIWRRHLGTGSDERLTDLRQVERNVRMLPDGNGIVYLHGVGGERILRMRNFLTGEDKPVVENSLTYHLMADVHPTRNVIAYSDAMQEDYQLVTMDLGKPGVTSQLTFGPHYAQSPAWSADGQSLYYVEPDERQQFRLMQVPAYGGDAEEVEVSAWNYGTRTGSLAISTREDVDAPVPARLTITDANGHPVASPRGATYVDPQTGYTYFYTDGLIELTLPAGTYQVMAARGPLSRVSTGEIRVRSGQSASLALDIEMIWDAEAAGYRSADYHVHVNGDGQHRASHEDMLSAIMGEALNHVAPMSWNRWERLIDRDIVGLQTVKGDYVVDQAQEVRSHFHGHVGLTRVDRPFHPWFFGPSNPAFADPNLTNGDVIDYAAATGAFATYVHPVHLDDDPFADPTRSPIPIELVSDSVLADRIGIEIVCNWTSSLATSEVWYRLLNIGKPVAAMSGTDGWTDFHRTPAMGTARSYIRVADGDDSFDAVLDQAIAGRSFVTTGPALLFEIGDGIQPGGVIADGQQSWSVELASSMAVDRVEILVNGNVVHEASGVAAGEKATLTGEVDLPEGGWIAARAYSSEVPESAWPSMITRPFAHSSPVWIGEVGSTDPAARSAAAADLLQALAVSDTRVREAYGEVDISRTLDRFARARALLEAIQSQE